MKDNFGKCLTLILHHEGGYVNHPRDPGGETNLGVTKRVYEEWGGTKDMKELTPEDVAPIYKKNYWDRGRCDDLPSGVDWCIFDWGVNSGVSRAAKALQRIIGVEADGGIGPMTFQAVANFEPEQIILKMHTQRKHFYEGLDVFATFGKGWLRRNNETKETALEMMD